MAETIVNTNTEENFFEHLFKSAEINCQKTINHIKSLFESDPNGQVFMEVLHTTIQENPEVLKKVQERLYLKPSHAPQYPTFGAQIVYFAGANGFEIKKQGIGMSCVYAFSALVKTGHSTECF